jgi:CubicO group peptidase (beta-lactamase class C family)
MFSSLLAFGLATAAGAQPAEPPDFTPALKRKVDNLFEQARESWQVPGAALAIVSQDRVVYLKAIGVKRKGDKAPVTVDTLFPLASCTKPFTTLAMAMLADDGVLTWDDRVRKHLPYFRLHDPLADAEVTLRDLVTHRTGVGSHELLWYRVPWSVEERVRKLAHLKPSHSFRSAFEYQTIAFGAAGLAAGSAAHCSWRDLLQKRVLDPLGMKGAALTTHEAKSRKDYASPHRKDKAAKVVDMPWYELKEPDPAGSLHASVHDLSKFLLFQLGDGTWQGKRLLSAEGLRGLHMPQIVVPLQGFARVMNPFTDQLSYGLGWIVQDYRGLHLLMHGGAIDGFRAHFTLVPKARLGFALLNNLNQSQMNLALSNSLLDLLFHLPDKDWNKYFHELQAEEKKDEERHIQAWRDGQKKGTSPSCKLASYAGEYEDPAYGIARIAEKDGRLVCTWSTFRIPLRHWHYDTFVGADEDFRNVAFTFSLGPDGAVSAVHTLERDFKRRRPD